MARRVISLWLPHFQAERMMRAGRAGVATPFAVTASERGALRLCSVNRAAAALGLEPGMALTDARALAPGLATTEAEPARDAAALSALVRWGWRFTPLVGPATPDGLVLDITGCAHLFGGEGAMLERISTALGRFGYTARAGCADTSGAAYALARFGAEAVAPPGQTRTAIADLPVRALRLEPTAVETLNRLGLTTIGAMAAQPRAPLTRRIGLGAIRRLDQALGRDPEPITPLREATPHAVRLSLPEPIGRIEDVMAGLTRLLDRLCTRLAAEGQGARRFRLSLMKCEGGTAAITIGLARARREPAMIARLFEPEIERVEAGFGFDALRLEALSVEPMRAAQITTERATTEALDDALSRIGNRIGFDNLIRFAPAESHIPERSVIENAAVFAEAVTAWPAPLNSRPLTLLSPEPVTVEDTYGTPQALHWRRGRYDILDARGPERIAPEWWLDDPAWRDGARDYWSVETRRAANGAIARLWLYTAGGRWFVHGVFA